MKKLEGLFFFLIFSVCLSNTTLAHFIVKPITAGIIQPKTDIDPPLISLLKKLENYNKRFPIEKVHIHLDKPYYAAGENIWFKAYVTNSQTANKSNLSQVLFVDLIDEKGVIYKQARIPLTQGLGHGDFAVADTVSEGNYRIRAYTSWMQNFESDFFFDKVIKIGNSWSNQINVQTDFESNYSNGKELVNTQMKLTHKNGSALANIPITYKIIDNDKVLEEKKLQSDANGIINFSFTQDANVSSTSKGIDLSISAAQELKVKKYIPVILASEAIDLQFFAEGGNLIEGISTKIAFKAVNRLGKGQKIKGNILDNEKRVIAEFESNELGMGSFYIIPQANQSYVAEAIHNQKKFEVKLPVIKKLGYALAVTQAENNITVKIEVSEDIYTQSSATDSMSIVLHKDGLPVISAQIAANKNASILKIPKDQIATGINTLTLFNSNQIPVAERVFFVFFEEDLIHVESEDLKSAYNTREEVKAIFSGTSFEMPVKSNYSVAITHSGTISPDEMNETNILTSLLLKGDLKGYIENPNYYFSSQDKQRLEDLDNLMLTQGWRKLNWENITREYFPALKYSPEFKIPITGVVTNMYGSPIAGARVSMFSPNNLMIADNTISDKDGRFIFKHFMFMDTTNIVVNAIRKNGAQDLKVQLDSFTLKNPVSKGSFADYTLNINNNLKKYLDNSQAYFEELKKQGSLNEVIRLKEVEIKGQYGNKITASRHSSNLNGPGNADIVIDTRDVPPTSMSVILIKSRYNSPPPSLSLSGGNTGMGVLVDGALKGYFLHNGDEQGQETKLFPPMSTIRSIEIIKPTSTRTTIYGSRFSDGLIIVTTKRGDEDDDLPKPKLTKLLENVGITSAREFYSPRHVANETKGPDLRNTVFWDPNILSDADGRFMLNYFNTDLPGTYRIVIEGISEEGLLARKVFTYNVR